MPNLDQFESVFRAAAKEPFRPRKVEIGSVLVVTDRDEARAGAFSDRLKEQLAKALGAEVRWRTLSGPEVGDVEKLLGTVNSENPDLVCTYRNLFSAAWKYPYSLGEHLDVLTQHTAVPVLVAPHPEAARESAHALKNTDHVLAVTNHLAGDHRLANFAARFTQPGGTLTLAHVEDDAEFNRFLDAISKIPTIDTDEARAKLSAQLLKEPRDYIESVRAGLAGRPKVEGVVAFGHRVGAVRKIVDEHHADLLVFNTMDEGQVAMHGLAYSLAVDIRQIPVLML